MSEAGAEAGMLLARGRSLFLGGAQFLVGGADRVLGFGQGIRGFERACCVALLGSSGLIGSSRCALGDV